MYPGQSVPGHEQTVAPFRPAWCGMLRLWVPSDIIETRMAQGDDLAEVGAVLSRMGPLSNGLSLGPLSLFAKWGPVSS